MKSLLPIVAVVLLSTGCGQTEDMQLASSASFDPKDNMDLKAHVTPLGLIDTSIVLEGTAKSPFAVTVVVSGKRGSSSSSSTTDILLEFKDGKLSSLTDWRSGGGGDGPAFRRESDTELTVYYPMTIGHQRTWVKFQVVKQ